MADGTAPCTGAVTGGLSMTAGAAFTGAGLPLNVWTIFCLLLAHASSLGFRSTWVILPCSSLLMFWTLVTFTGKSGVL